MYGLVVTNGLVYFMYSIRFFPLTLFVIYFWRVSSYFCCVHCMKHISIWFELQCLQCSDFFFCGKTNLGMVCVSSLNNHFMTYMFQFILITNVCNIIFTFILLHCVMFGVTNLSHYLLKQKITSENNGY